MNEGCNLYVVQEQDPDVQTWVLATSLEAALSKWKEGIAAIINGENKTVGIEESMLPNQIEDPVSVTLVAEGYEIMR